MSSAARQEMERDRQLLAGQVAILTMIARDAPPIDTLNALVGLAESLEPVAIAGVTIVDRAGQSLEMAAFPSVHHAFADAIAGVPLGPPHVGTCAQALFNGEAVTSEDLGKDGRFAKEWIQLCADHGIRSCRSQPVRSPQGAPLGAFMLCFPEPRTADAFDEKLIAVCANLVELTLERRRVREQQELIFGELQHRVRNLFASVSALANASFNGDIGISGFRASFQGRLNAMANAHSLMFAEGSADLGRLLRDVLEPYGLDQRIEIAGPPISLDSDAASGFAMAFHELATNAAKYGALSRGEGNLKIAWSASADGKKAFTLEWIESGGPPVQPPTRKGFGVRAVERMLASTIEGQVRLDFGPEGLRCVIEAPFSKSLWARR